MNGSSGSLFQPPGFLTGAVAARWGGVALAVACLVGCGEPPMTSYRAPKDKHTEASLPEPPAHGHGTVRPEPASLQWKLPAGWKETAPGRMSLAAFAIAGGEAGEAQVNITVLPNLAGHEADIINMWRQQMGLTALSEEEAARSLHPIQAGQETGSLFEVSAAADAASGSTRIVTAMVHRADGSWFYKLAGNSKIVEAQKPAFIEFLKSIRIQPAAVVAAVPPPAAPPSASADASSPKWKVSASWTPVAAGQMQLAKFAVPPRGSARAEVSVSVFPGDTGGPLGNVNRWRRQIGLGPVTEADLPQQITVLDPSHPQAFLTEQKNNGQQLVAAVVPRGGQWYFYKLLGDAAAVGPEKDAFVAFVRSEP
jgi:hypothetical protein